MPLAAIATLVAAGSSMSAPPPPNVLAIELRADIDYVDPALSYYIYSWQIEYATCAKLMNHADRPPPEGSVVQPEVATGLPMVSPDGTTYTFHLRNDFFFSPPSNERVTAAHYEHAFDRVLTTLMNSPGKAFFADVVDVVAVNAETLQITLAQPAGDFLARMTLPFTCPLPLSIPIEPSGIGAPVPSAGPYYISGWTRGQSIVVKENPNYLGDRPHRFDEIHYGIGRTLDDIKSRIDTGDTDTGDIPAAAHADLGLLYGPGSPAALAGRQRYFYYPSPTVHYLAMNHDRPLFGEGGPLGNVSLKKAVNYAIDRTALMELRGAYAGSPTDQHLPPGIPGYQDAAIYPSSPDVSQARALAGCAENPPSCPQRQGVLYCSNTAVAMAQCELVRQNLSAIGLDMTVMHFPRAVQFQRAGTRGEPFDMTLEGWHMDYYDPFDFLFLLDGELLQPANNVNFAYFDDPDFSANLAAADALTGAARANALGDLDVGLAQNAAPWASFGVPNDRYYFSDRIGCHTYVPAWTYSLGALCVRPVITIGDAEIAEGNSGSSVATFTVRVAEAAATDYPLTLSFSTADGTAGSGDYVPQSGSLTFESGEKTETISIEVVGDATEEADESFAVQLSNASGGTLVDGRATGTIRNDDAAPPPPQSPPPPAAPPPPAPPPAPPPPPVRPPAVVRCVVPNVRGQTVRRARATLTRRRCRLGRVTRAYSVRVRTGRIISQSRRPGVRLPRGTRVNVVVSRGKRR